MTDIDRPGPRSKWRPNPHYVPYARPPKPQPRVSVRCDLLAKAADLIADRDPDLSELFKRMAANPEKEASPE